MERLIGKRKFNKYKNIYIKKLKKLKILTIMQFG